MALAKTSSDLSNLVSDYLRTHPDFFLSRPETLKHLTLGHTTGKNVASLIELQVERLRQTVQLLEKENHSLRTINENNESLAAKTKQALTILDRCDNDAELFRELQCIARNLFDTDELNLFIFSDQSLSIRQAGIYLEPQDSRLRRMFIELFNRNKPLCDSLQDEYVDTLFGKPNTMQSTLLIPCSTADSSFLFAFGSQNRNVYQQGVALKLLTLIVDRFIFNIREIIQATA